MLGKQPNYFPSASLPLARVADRFRPEIQTQFVFDQTPGFPRSERLPFKFAKDAYRGRSLKKSAKASWYRASLGFRLQLPSEGTPIAFLVHFCSGMPDPAGKTPHGRPGSSSIAFFMCLDGMAQADPDANKWSRPSGTSGAKASNLAPGKNGPALRHHDRARQAPIPETDEPPRRLADVCRLPRNRRGSREITAPPRQQTCQKIRFEVVRVVFQHPSQVFSGIREVLKLVIKLAKKDSHFAVLRVSREKPAPEL